MGRHKDYSKSYVEDYSQTMDIYFLKKYGYLDVNIGMKTGVLTWSRRGEKTGSIGIEVTSESFTNVNKYGQTKVLRIHFTQTHKETGEEKNFDYKVRLVSTSCNYGGVRWWFVCPCGGNRCGKLYLQRNGYFASRKTLGLKYEDQNQSRKWREFNQIFAKEYEAENIYKTIKYKYRNGKPTRKYKSYLKLIRNHLTYDEQEKAMTRLLTQ